MADCWDTTTYPGLKIASTPTGEGGQALNDNFGYLYNNPGPQGPEGPQGPMGPTGPMGPQGDIGMPGAQGNQGDQGGIGLTGPQGWQGNVGAPGPQGDQGAPGTPGTPGDQGVQGPQGANGADGAQGATGDTGPTGVTGAEGPQGSQGPQGDQGNQGFQGTPGDKMAIVPARDQYVGLYCVESPEVLFEDTLTIPLTGDVTDHWIDPVFREVCEPASFRIVGFSTPTPALVGLALEGACVRVTIEGRRPTHVVVRVSGVRKGRGGLRFPQRTREQMDHNNAFWEQARCS